MRVNSKIRIDSRKLAKLTTAAVAALEETAEELHTEVKQAQVIPRDTGALHENTFIDFSESKSGVVSLVSSTPYARRLYFHPEYHFQQIENPNAKGKWFEDWLPGGSKEHFCRDTFKEIYKRLAGM